MKTTELNHKKTILICSFAAVILIIIAPFAMIISMKKSERLQSNGLQATAEIISFDLETTVESEKAIISFSDQSGSVHTVPLGFYSSDIYIGMKVPILYDPENTSDIMYIGDNSSLINYGAGVLMLTGALILGYVAVSTYITYRKIKGGVQNSTFAE